MLGVRHGQVFILFGSVIMCLVIRLDLSVGIVAMTDINSQSKHEQTEKVFNWSPVEKGVLLGMYFNGLVVSGLPSGFIANRLKVRYLLSASHFISGLLSLSFPQTAINTGFTTLCASRVFVGMVQGVVFPCVAAHLAKWSAPSERSIFASIAYAGVSVGAIVVHAASGLLAATKWGWPSIFYASGSSSIVWGAICFWFLRDTPREHKRFSGEEKGYSQTKSRRNADKSDIIPMPWKSIIMSGPVWAIVCAACSFYWGIWTLDTMLPTYIKAVYHIDIARVLIHLPTMVVMLMMFTAWLVFLQNGLLSSLPDAGMLISSLVGPIMSHYFSKWVHSSFTVERKFWNSVGMFGGGLCFLLMGTVNLSPTGAIVLLTVGNFLLTCIQLGFKCNVLDLAPNFSAVITGFTNGLGQIPCLLAPNFTGFVLEKIPDPVNAWSTVFITAAAVSYFGGIVYIILGSAETQEWNNTEPTESTESFNGITCLNQKTSVVISS